MIRTQTSEVIDEKFNKLSDKLLNSNRESVELVFMEFMDYINNNKKIYKYIASLIKRPEAMHEDIVVEYVLEESRKLYNGNLFLGESLEDRLNFVYHWLNNVAKDCKENPDLCNLGNYFLMKGTMYCDSSDYDELYEAFKENIFKLFIDELNEYMDKKEKPL